MKTLRALAFVSLLILFSFLVSAHLDSGEDLHKDGYILDFGYSPSQVQVTKPASLLFILVNETTEEPINYSSLFLRISSEKEVVFSGSFLPKNGGVSFVYTFSKPGKYTIDANFINGSETLEKGMYDVSVSGESNLIYYLILGVVLLFLIVSRVFLIKRMKKGTK